MLGLSLDNTAAGWPIQAPVLDGLEALESAGFGAVTVPEHHLRSFGQTFYNPLIVLASLAPRTKSMVLGQSVVLASFYHPIMLAEQVATLDRLSGGRVMLGVGVGWDPREFEAFGIPFETRFSRYSETVEIVRALWQGEEVAYRGKHFVLDKVDPGLGPSRMRSIPIYMAGMADPALERVARMADGWLPSAWISKSELSKKMSVLQAFREKLGLQTRIPVAIMRYTVIRRNSIEARAVASRSLGSYLRPRAEWGHPLIGANWDADAPGSAFEDRVLVGDAETLVNELLEYHRMGVDQINLRFSLETMSAADVEESLRIAVEEVLPRIRKTLGEPTS